MSVGSVNWGHLVTDGSAASGEAEQRDCAGAEGGDAAGTGSGGAHDGERVLGTEPELARSRGGWGGRGQARS